LVDDIVVAENDVLLDSFWKEQNENKCGRVWVLFQVYIFILVAKKSKLET
jgi:hypothetical protein